MDYIERTPHIGVKRYLNAIEKPLNLPLLEGVTIALVDLRRFTTAERPELGRPAPLEPILEVAIHVE